MRDANKRRGFIPFAERKKSVPAVPLNRWTLVIAIAGLALSVFNAWQAVGTSRLDRRMRALQVVNDTQSVLTRRVDVLEEILYQYANAKHPDTEAARGYVSGKIAFYRNLRDRDEGMVSRWQTVAERLTSWKSSFASDEEIEELRVSLSAALPREQEELAYYQRRFDELQAKNKLPGIFDELGMH